ncbi:LysR family transcriptional regulator [Salinicola rhizosphaerae]|nr:LysR family transcriptional regulator [Salinicola rhizosphaerae]
MSDIDLNLLVALDVLLEEQSVTAAAKRLRLSPSAMSRTLKRLRDTTGDPLLVRAGRGLVPTPRAIELRERAHVVAREAKSLLSPARGTFDTASLVRTFTLRANAAFIERFSVSLITAIRGQAPGVNLRFAPKPSKTVEPLRDGEIDLEIGVIETNAPELMIRGLFEDRFVGVAPHDHPILTGDATQAHLASCRLVLASPNGEFSGPMASTLQALGLAPPFYTVVPTFADALRIVAGTDHVTIVPDSCLPDTSRELESRSLKRFTLPVPTRPFRISALWHPRWNADPAHRWFRESVMGLVRAPEAGLAQAPESGLVQAPGAGLAQAPESGLVQTHDTD